MPVYPDAAHTDQDRAAGGVSSRSSDLGPATPLARRMTEVAHCLNAEQVRWAPVPLSIEISPAEPDAVLLTVADIPSLSLRDWLAVSRFDRAGTRLIAKKLAEMLGELEAMGASHGDLTVDSVHIKVDGSPLLVDFDRFYVPAMAAWPSPADSVLAPDDLGWGSPTADRLSGWVLYLSALTLSAYPSVWDNEPEPYIPLAGADLADLGASQLVQRLVDLPHPIATAWRDLIGFARLPEHLIPPVSDTAGELLLMTAEFDAARSSTLTSTFLVPAELPDRKRARQTHKRWRLALKGTTREIAAATRAVSALEKQEDALLDARRKAEAEAGETAASAEGSLRKWFEAAEATASARRRSIEAQRETALRGQAAEIAGRHVTQVLGATPITPMPGIARGMLRTLASNGFRVAADVQDVRSTNAPGGQRVVLQDSRGDWRLVPGLGMAKGSTLLAWRRSIEAEARRNAPTPSPADLRSTEQRFLGQLNKAQAEFAEERRLMETTRMQNAQHLETARKSISDEAVRALHELKGQSSGARRRLAEAEASLLLVDDERRRAEQIVALSRRVPRWKRPGT